MLTCKANTTRLNTITPQSIITVWRIETLHTLVVGRVAQWRRCIRAMSISRTFSARVVNTIQVWFCHAVAIANAVETEIVAADLVCCQQPTFRVHLAAYLCSRTVSICQTCNTSELIGRRIHNTSLIHPTIEIGEAIHTLMATCDLVANTVRTAGWHTTLTLETNGATLNAVAEETIIAI